MIELVVTDLDGTLWDSDFNVPDQTKVAIKELESRGIPVIAASARGAHTAGAHLREHGLDLDMVCYNGALGKMYSGETFYKKCYSGPEARSVLEAFRARGLTPAIAVDHPEYVTVTGAESSCTPGFLEYARHYLKVVDLDWIVDDVDCLQIFVNGADYERLSHVYASLDGLDVEAYLMKEETYGPPGFWSLLTAPANVSKWAGIVEYCRFKGLNPSRVLAVGDGANDIAMLSSAKVACVMAHAQPNVVAAADHILDARRGWSAVLDHV